jgi:hypothetical protein
MGIEKPPFGMLRVRNELNKNGIFISPFGVSNRTKLNNAINEGYRSEV